MPDLLEIEQVGVLDHARDARLAAHPRQLEDRGAIVSVRSEHGAIVSVRSERGASGALHDDHQVLTARSHFGGRVSPAQG